MWSLSGRNAIEHIKSQAISVSMDLSLLRLISRMAEKRYTEQCDRETLVFVGVERSKRWKMWSRNLTLSLKGFGPAIYGSFGAVAG